MFSQMGNLRVLIVLTDFLGYTYAEVMARNILWRFANELLDNLHGIASVTFEITITTIGF